MPRFRVRSVLFELPSSPDATMSDERGAVRSVCDSRSNFFRGCQYTQSSYLREGAVHNGGHRKGRQGAAAVSASSQGWRYRQRVPSPSESCLRKGRLPTRCQGASSQVEPGCDAEGGLLTSTTSLVAGDGGWLPRMALTRSSCVRQPTYGIGRGRAPDTAHVAVGSIAPLWPHPKTVGFASIAPGAIRRTAFRAFRGQAAPCRFCVDLG